MNGEIDISISVNNVVNDNMDSTSCPASPASQNSNSAPSLEKPSQATADSHRTNNHTTENSANLESSNHTKYSNHSDDSNGDLRANDHNNAELENHCTSSDDSTTQFAASSRAKNKADSSGTDYESETESENESGKVHNITLSSESNDEPKKLQLRVEESDSDRDSDGSSDDNSDSSDEDTIEGEEEPVSIHSDSGSEVGIDKSDINIKKNDVILVDDLTQHDDKNEKTPDRKAISGALENKSPNSNDVSIANETGAEKDCKSPEKPNKLAQTPNKSISDNSEDAINDEGSGLTPRRSARVIKRKSYKENDEENDFTIKNRSSSELKKPVSEDPLNLKIGKARPIVVSDTKKLVDLAMKQPSKLQIGHKSEPTVVIIDTNSILSGKGSLPVQPKPYAVLPTSLSQQNLYQSIAARGTTVTPVSMKQSAIAAPPHPTPSPVPNILPSLTDDMFVVEAPSFIVPYVYEKPSVKPFREFVDTLGKDLDERRKKEESEKAEREKQKKASKQAEANKMEIDQEERNGEDSNTASKSIDLTKSDKSIDLTKSDKVEYKSKRLLRKEKMRRLEEDDCSWDGESSSDSDDESDEETPKTVIIKEKEDEAVAEIKDAASPADAAAPPAAAADTKEGKSDGYFDNSLGKFFINVGVSLVQEYVQTDLLKQQKRRLHKETRCGGANVKSTELAIASLMRNLNFSKEKNAPYKFEQKKCEFCSFKTESLLVMAHHMETPHMKNNVYKCNFCSFEVRSPHDILFHMEAEHNMRGRLERAPAYHQCANCPFEDNAKGKLARHLIACAKKFKPDLNLAPPMEWEPPAKIPKITRPRNNLMGTYQAAYARAQVGMPIRPQLNISGTTNLGSVGIMSQTAAAMFRGRGRPQAPMQQLPTPRNAGPMQGLGLPRSGVVIRHPTSSVLLPPNYNLTGSAAGKPIMAQTKSAHQPSISITPLPRAPQPPLAGAGGGAAAAAAAPGTAAKGTFVICEICDGYIKDLEQLRNHMQWIHKVKIHPKMIYNRPPLNCQKCQFRFFTDQGLERHLLGSHGLVTSSMQEAANKGKDAGRCPVCGRVYQWKLLNHVARDHSMTLKPAHLSYKCTVCTATFGMYKQFENHVYSAHSVVAKRVMDKNKAAPPQPPPPPGAVGLAVRAGDAVVRPLKINDEITIIPQPSKLTASPAVKPAAKGHLDK